MDSKWKSIFKGKTDLLSSKFVLLTTFKMRICVHFNTKKGCTPPSGNCSFEHVLYCTNPLCEGASAKTHTLAVCGRKGGGAHEAYIAAKREESMAAKAAKKAKEAAEAVTEVKPPEEGATKFSIQEKLYEQIYGAFTEKPDSYKTLMEMYPLDLPPNRVAGKIVGMLGEGLELDELNGLTTDHTERNKLMIEALDVLLQHKDSPHATA